MAISDTLSNAVEEIRGYLDNQPDVYAYLRPQLDCLVARMELVRVALDRPPFNDPTGPLANASRIARDL